MDDDWDADDFDPDKGFQAESQFAGEDEHLSKVKESWDASDDDKPAKSVATGPKKSKAERIEEKKAQRRKELEAAEGDLSAMDLSEDQERRRKEQLQKQADLQNAVDLFGSSTVPTSPEECAQLGRTLADQLLKFEKLPGYFGLLENLIRDSCVTLDAEDCRKLGGVLSSLAQEKQKLAKSKAPTKKKSGKKLNTSKAVRHDEFDLDGTGGADDYGDEYDFM